MFWYPLFKKPRKVKSDQNSVSHFLFLAANTLSQFCLSLIMLRKNFSSNQDLQCNSCIELTFLQSKIRERRGWGKAFAAENKKCDMEF